MKILVRLGSAELEAAAHGGANRRIRAMAKGRRPNQPERPEWEQNWFQTSIIGAIGEYAVAKALGEQWEDLEEDPNGKDVLEYQVRTIENPAGGLKVRRRDNHRDIFILAQVSRNKVLIHGWMPGYQVVALGTEIYPDCWTIPTAMLYQMADLPEEIYWSDTVIPYARQLGATENA